MADVVEILMLFYRISTAHARLPAPYYATASAGVEASSAPPETTPRAYREDQPAHRACIASCQSLPRPLRRPRFRLIAS